MKGLTLILSTLSILLFATTALSAQSQAVMSKDFLWSGELVALDSNARMLTVKARVVGPQALAEFPKLNSSQRVQLVWSGIDKYSDAIREVRTPTPIKADERFTFEAEFVSFDAPTQFATFKVQVPESSIPKLAVLKPGEWVTATSPHGMASQSTPVIAARSWADRSSATNVSD
jgi:hypothetical protein